MAFRAARAEACEGMNRRRLLVVIALLGMFLRVAPALRDLDTVDRIFVPDDTYYTLAISRSLANGNGPTVDGMTRTSGFQPLLAFVTVPVFFVTDDPDLPLRYVILLGALADVLTILLLARLARRVAGDDAALIAASLWAVSPLAIANALGGLETGLALCVQLALVEAWCVARERRTLRSYLVAGALAGLALLARVDSAFLVAGLGALELWNGDRRRLGVAIGAAAIVVAPWWGYSIAAFGSPVPESGAAVRDVVAMHRALYLKSHMAAGWAAGTVLGAPILDLGALREWLFHHAAAAWAAWLAVVALGAAASNRWLRLRDERADRRAGGARVGDLRVLYVRCVGSVVLSTLPRAGRVHDVAARRDRARARVADKSHRKGHCRRTRCRVPADRARRCSTVHVDHARRLA